MNNEEPQKKRLKPLVFREGHVQKTSNNTTQQMLLLKALQVTNDPKKLREMIGVKAVSDVYRTLDKLSMRKEFHQALADNEFDFGFIVKGIKELATKSFKDEVRLKAFQTILKSVGLDKYDADAGAGAGSWEEVLLKKIEAEKSSPKQLESGGAEIPEYEVQIPEVPESVKKMRVEEAEVVSSVYKIYDEEK